MDGDSQRHQNKPNQMKAPHDYLEVRVDQQGRFVETGASNPTLPSPRERVEAAQFPEAISKDPVVPASLALTLADELESTTAQLTAALTERDEARDKAASAKRLYELNLRNLERWMELHAKAEAENAALKAAHEWRDIATAPKDGTRILARHKAGRPFTAHYWNSIWRDEFDNFRDPTHWLPLPEPTATKI